MNIAAILPCRGRPEQTVANVRRLLATAGYDDWHLYLAGGDDEVGTIWKACSQTDISGERISMVTTAARRVTYWQALTMATEHTDATHLINLANDLIPVGPWLRRAVEAYQEAFGPNAGLLGFNGDGHPLEHSCHFLVDRGLLAAFGGWPVWYDHNFGDTELCQRAIAANSYAKAPWAILAHDHPYFGGADDAVYQEGRARSTQDQRLYEQRRRQGWPTV